MEAFSWKGPEGLLRIHIDRRQRADGYAMKEPHSHSYYELICIENGFFRFLVEDRLYELREGDLLLLPPHFFHYTRLTSGNCRRSAVYFRLEDLPEGVVAQMPGGAEFFTHPRLFQMPDAYRRHLTGQLSRMSVEEKICDARSGLLLSLQLQELFLLCSRFCIFLQDLPDDIHTTDRQVLQAARYMHEHFRQPITAADIAAASGFSPNYLSRKFREATGVGVHEYLVFIRLRTAALELVSTDESVTQIALRCGFSDSNYFKDVFKKKYGVTPREYRKTH